MILAKLDHRSRAFNAGAGLHGTWFVVDSRMNHSAVVAGLMASQPIFLFDQ